MCGVCQLHPFIHPKHQDEPGGFGGGACHVSVLQPALNALFAMQASTEKVNAASTTTAIAGNSSVPPAAGQHDAAVQQQPTAGTPTTVQQPSDAMSLPQGPQQHPQEQHPQQPQPPQQQEPTHSSQAVQQQQQQLVQDPEQQQQQQYDKPAKRRGRPPGAKNKDTLAKAGTAGPLLTFVLHIEPGEVCTLLALHSY